MNQTLLWIISTVVTGALLPMVGVIWRLVQVNARDRIACVSETSELRVRLAVAETKLAGYGASAPDLARDIDEIFHRLGDGQIGDHGLAQNARPKRPPRVWPTSPTRRALPSDTRRDRR